jgi:hypothetical protein
MRSPTISWMTPLRHTTMATPTLLWPAILALVHPFHLHLTATHRTVTFTSHLRNGLREWYEARSSTL